MWKRFAAAGFIAAVFLLSAFCIQAAQWLRQAAGGADELHDWLPQAMVMVELEQQLVRYEVLQWDYLRAAEEERAASLAPQMERLEKTIRNLAADQQLLSRDRDLKERIDAYFLLGGAYLEMADQGKKEAEILLRGQLRADVEAVKLQLGAIESERDVKKDGLETNGLGRLFIEEPALAGKALESRVEVLRAVLEMSRNVAACQIELARGGAGQEEARHILTALDDYERLLGQTSGKSAAEEKERLAVNLLRELARDVYAKDRLAARREFEQEAVEIWDYIGALRSFHAREADMAAARQIEGMARAFRCVAALFAVGTAALCMGVLYMVWFLRGAARQTAQNGGEEVFAVRNEPERNKSCVKASGRRLHFHGVISLLIEYESCAVILLKSADASAEKIGNNVVCIGKNGKRLWNIQELLCLPTQEFFPDIWKEDASSLLVWNKLRVCYRIDMEHFQIIDIRIPEKI